MTRIHLRHIVAASVEVGLVVAAATAVTVSWPLWALPYLLLRAEEESFRDTVRRQSAGGG